MADDTFGFKTGLLGFGEREESMRGQCLRATDVMVGEIEKMFGPRFSFFHNIS